MLIYFIAFHFIIFIILLSLPFFLLLRLGLNFKSDLPNMIAYTNGVVIVVVIGYLIVVSYRLVYQWESRPETSSTSFCRSVCRMKGGWLHIVWIVHTEYGHY
ncbi:hypothetical protein BDV40DRAFT_263811 [Aspergillus tamarii]|uniref:Uncharacterized protein n=1 Tax=Aspergillus tamarii TaxID=41984 RepID=A0A5N6UWQ5_ASPTM|nr:hypothetical protein BDV40DRAFT_263811 [Aspergillus tamarii]